MGMGSIRARQPHPSGPSPEANLLRSRLKPCPNRPKPLDSPEFGRAEARDPLTRRAGTRQMTAARSIPKLWRCPSRFTTP